MLRERGLCCVHVPSLDIITFLLDKSKHKPRIMSRLPDSRSLNIGLFQDFALREKQPTAIDKLVSELFNFMKKKSSIAINRM